MKKMLVMLAVASTGILIAAGYSEHANKDFLDPFDGSVDHIHGIGYIADDESLYAAAHTGLKIHQNGDWLRTTKNKNDYTSFTTVDQGFFASGIPEEGSDLPTPLGLQYSVNGGEDLETIDFEWQSNFHALAVGYTSHDIFLLNTQKELLQGEGFYRSPDFGKTWDKASANGLLGAVNGLALHPADSSYVAAASSTGIYLSIDGGENFQSLTGEGESGTAVFFSEDHLYFAGYDKGARLIRYDLQKEEMTPMKLPLTERDTAVFLVQHPDHEERLAIYSLQGHIYITEDGTETWEQILTGNKVH